MVGGTVAAPLGECRDNFDTEDSSQCVSVEHDRNTGENIQGVLYQLALYWKVKRTHILILTFSGDVNVTLSCCVYNDKMLPKDTMISANAYRCEILVCEEKVVEKNVNLDKSNHIPEVGPGGRDCF